MWDVEVTDQFLDWWQQLTTDQQESITARVELLAERGPDLGRPVVDRIHSSRHQHMKELRAAKDGAIRVLFAFDPRRTAILLLGGDKSRQWAAWYCQAVPVADDLYDTHLQELHDEGMI
jgi:hypothetical protein